MSVLELTNVSKSFGGVPIVADVSIGFGRGRVTALLGPNGAGKTTVFNLISGVLRPDAGTICYGGLRIDGLAPWKIARLGVGRMFQDVRLFGRMTVRENILAAFKGQRGEHALAAVFTPRNVRKRDAALCERAARLLDFVGLSGRGEELSESLSYGQQKLVAIARLMAMDADLLLLDEPTAGVSPRMVGEIAGVIRRLAAEGKTIVIIEHNMNVILEIADWLYFMSEGGVASFGLPDDVLGDAEVRRLYVGV
jgi:branched-chain amino acid transport system permease protein